MFWSNKLKELSDKVEALEFRLNNPPKFKRGDLVSWTEKVPYPLCLDETYKPSVINGCTVLSCELNRGAGKLYYKYQLYKNLDLWFANESQLEFK